MTMTILIQLPGQKIARPMNRACSVSEAQEILEYWARHHFGEDFDVEMIEANIDTETPVLTYPFKGQGLANVYIFREA